MHLICESRLYTESSVSFAHNLLVKCSLFISQSDYRQKCILFCRDSQAFRKLYAPSATTYYIMQIPHHYDK